jgi:hypothetical protein
MFLYKTIKMLHSENIWLSVKPEVHPNDIKNTVPTSQKTPFLSITNTMWLKEQGKFVPHHDI